MVRYLRMNKIDAGVLRLPSPGLAAQPIAKGGTCWVVSHQNHFNRALLTTLIYRFQRVLNAILPSFKGRSNDRLRCTQNHPAVAEDPTLLALNAVISLSHPINGKHLSQPKDAIISSRTRSSHQVRKPSPLQTRMNKACGGGPPSQICNTLGNHNDTIYH